MGMSQSYGTGDDDESIATIRHALDSGVTLLDTANVYGDGLNERLVGKAIEGRRADVVLATKFGIIHDQGTQHVRGDPAYVRQCCEESLHRLGVEHIDLYYQHRVDPDVPVEETVGAMSELVTEGKIGRLGISEAGAETIRRAHATHPLAALQSEWSLWTRGIEDEVLPTCRELGIGVVPFSPLGRGFLTGAINSVGELGEGDMRRRLPRFEDGNFEHNLAIVRALRELAGQKNVKPGQLALAWLSHQGEDVVPIPGTKRRGYLDENIASVDIELSADELRAVADAAPPEQVAGDRYPADIARHAAN